MIIHYHSFVSLVSGRGLRGALLREVDGQPQLVAAVDRERLLLRPDHARDLKGPARWRRRVRTNFTGRALGWVTCISLKTSNSDLQQGRRSLAETKRTP